MEVYQKAPPKVKHTDITQKSTNWSQELGNIKSLKNKTTKSKKTLKHSNKPCGIEKWDFQSTRLKRTKRPRPKSNIPASLKNPQIGPGNQKTSNVGKKTNKILKKILKHSNKPCSIEK